MFREMSRGDWIAVAIAVIVTVVLLMAAIAAIKAITRGHKVRNNPTETKIVAVVAVALALVVLAWVDGPIGVHRHTIQTRTALAQVHADNPGWDIRKLSVSGQYVVHAELTHTATGAELCKSTLLVWKPHRYVATTSRPDCTNNF